MVVLHTSWFLHITVLFTFYGAFVVPILDNVQMMRVETVMSLLSW